MALGKAFIEVHADTKPFARELESELKKVLSSMSNADVDKAGRQIGGDLSRGIGRGIEANTDHVRKSLKKTVDDSSSSNIFSGFSKGIVDTIDDGLSGLPAELKVALGAGLALLTPLIGASLSGLIAAALAAGFAGMGVLIAFQFERVRTEGKELLTFLRTLFVTLGEVFVEPVLLAFRTIETRFAKMAPKIGNLFAIVATFIEPLTDGLVGFFEELLPGLTTSLENSAGLVDTLAFHFKVLGRVIGEALMIITGSEDVEQGLADILTIVEAVILTFANLLAILTDIYGVMRNLAPFFATLLALTGIFNDNGVQADEAGKKVGGFASSMQEAIAPTEAEEQALKDINDQIKAFTDATGSAWQSNINFEKSLDDTAETLKKNKGALDINTRAGQENQQALLNSSQALIKQRNDTIALTGDTEAANKTFETNRKRLEDAAVAAGISRTEFQNLTGAILSVPPPISPGVEPAATQSVKDATGRWQGLSNAIAGAIRAAREALNYTFGIPTSRGGIGKAAAHAQGGVFSSAHMGVVAEDGPEAIIPLSKPARAAQVMQEAGLAGMGAVNVYIGNQQLDAYIDRRVDRQMSMTARSMAYGSRPV